MRKKIAVLIITLSAMLPPGCVAPARAADPQNKIKVENKADGSVVITLSKAQAQRCGEQGGCTVVSDAVMRQMTVAASKMCGTDI